MQAATGVERRERAGAASERPVPGSGRRGLRPAPGCVKPVLLLLLGVIAFPAAGQQDKQTDDIRERDRRYYERQTRPPEQAEPQEPAGEEPSRKELVDAFLAEADRLVRDRNYEYKTTPHYRVQTDDPRLDPVAAALLLESFRSFFGEFWAGRLEVKEDDATSRIFLFYSYFKYNQLLTGRKLFDSFRSAGHYRPFFDVVVIHTDSVAPADLPATLVHEAAHQLMARQVVGMGFDVPWLSEGLAAYFGYTRRGPDGRFEAGSIGGKGTSLFRDMKKGTEASGARRLKDAKRVMRREQPPALDALLRMGRSEFYGEEIADHYTLSWLLVHYLFHGEGGGLAAPFVTYLQSEIAGAQGAEALFAALGRTPEELSQGFESYVLALKDGKRKKR